ncbi:MAG TPA: YggT family protein [Dehalococcoidia bacterium]|nr:YggT family protein [Dehalococcoidia bacterium]
MNVTDYVLQALSWIIRFLILVIIIRAVISWFPLSRDNAFVLTLDRLSEPVIAPLRRVVPPLGMIDITPLVALILLRIVDTVILSMCLQCS